MIKILSTINTESSPDPEDCQLMWWTHEKELRFFFGCSDFFMWGCADLERITDDDMESFQETVNEIHALPASNQYEYDSWIARLWIARKRQCRPQVAYYERIPKVLHSLFDSCNMDPSEQYGSKEFNEIRLNNYKKVN